MRKDVLTSPQAQALGRWFVRDFLRRSDPLHEQREMGYAATLLRKFEDATIRACCLGLRAGAYGPSFEKNFASLAYLSSPHGLGPGVVRSPLDLQRASEQQDKVRHSLPVLIDFRTTWETHLYHPPLENEESERSEL